MSSSSSVTTGSSDSSNVAGEPRDKVIGADSRRYMEVGGGDSCETAKVGHTYPRELINS